MFIFLRPMFGFERKLNISLLRIPAVGSVLNLIVMFNKSLLQAYGAPSAVVQSALRAHNSFAKVGKLSLQRFNASIEAAESLAELRYWFDVTKKEKLVHKESGAPLPDWYTFCQDVTGIGKSWAAYLLQAQGLIDAGAKVEEYLTAETEGKSDLKRFIKWAKEGTLERPETDKNETAEGEAEGGAEGGADIQVRAEGCVINIYADGRVEAKGSNVAQVLDTLFAAVAASGLI